MAKNEIARVLIFTGAGASAPLGLPISSGFIEHVEKGMRPITSQVRSYLGTVDGNDIEWILSALETFSTEVEFTEHILPFLAQGDSRAVQIQGHFQKSIRTAKKEASAEIRRIKKLIFEMLSSYKPENAEALYKNLLLEVRQVFSSPAVSIITSNYDLSFENAVESLDSSLKDMGIDEVNYGFATKFGRPIYDSTQDANWNPRVLEFLKVHGSLDWHRDSQGRCSRSMSNTIPDDPDQMAILYPGFKGVPELEPFISLHGKLNQRLSEADLAIVIGFAFRDAYINSIFDNALRLRKELRVIYFNPLAIDEHPDGSIAPRLDSQYAGFCHVKKGVSLEEDPLGLGELVLKQTN